jgi:drug/metabolite transporter (DMT)-like permease
MSSGLVRLINPNAQFTLNCNNLIFGLIMATCGYAFQYTLNESIRLEKNTNILAIIGSSSILITYLMDTILIGTPFTWTSLIGSILVFGSVAFTVIYNNKH